MSDDVLNAFPSLTSATWSRNTGTPRASLTTICFTSSTDAISPMPRTISQAPFDSRTLPPTLTLLSRTAETIALSGSAYWRRRSGSTSIWYCCTWPPTEATSATPGTALSW